MKATEQGLTFRGFSYSSINCFRMFFKKKFDDLSSLKQRIIRSTSISAVVPLVGVTEWLEMETRRKLLS